MDKKLVAATALAGSLAMASFVWGTAQATPAPSSIHAPGNAITLVGHQAGGGGGGGGGGGPGGGGSVHVGGGGGGPGLSGGGGGRSFTRGGGGPSLGGGPRGARSFADNGPGHVYSRSYAGRDFNRSGPNGDIRRGNSQAFNRDRDHGDRNHGDRNRRFAERDHDRNHDFDHNGRHRVFRNGVWIWVYGPDYYSYNDCWWLRERALATGNPYWWSRYNNCVGYY
jgi:hypothetical protein